MPPFGARVFKAGVHAFFAKRQAGTLLHPTSLPGPYGIGDIGPTAHAFIDWLAQSGQSLWQILPLGPVDDTGSPYQSSSAFAGNLLLISLEDLQVRGLLDSIEIPAGLSPDRVEYEKVTAWKTEQLRRAFAAFRQKPVPSDYRHFLRTAAEWLEDYALFMALKDLHGGLVWTAWEAGAARRKPRTLARYRRELADEIDFYRFGQYVFFSQWEKLHAHAAALGIQIVGDVPIFVAHDSADVWARPELFALNRQGQPLTKAGVPPDYFSKTGQLWGNPHYKWTTHAAEDYDWWVSRLRWLFQSVDAIRMDHFRGFEAFWEVPAHYKTARKGRWVQGPGRELFLALRRRLGKLPILAEDLGVITPAVEALKEEFFLPGMAVLPFSIWKEGEKVHWPAPTPNTFYYTGTHDNDTLLGWLNEIYYTDADLYTIVATYAGRSAEIAPRRLVSALIEQILQSDARIAMIPVQTGWGLLLRQD